jgi:hypothetical protein
VVRPERDGLAVLRGARYRSVAPELPVKHDDVLVLGEARDPRVDREEADMVVPVIG